VWWADVVSLIRELLGGDSTGVEVAGVGVSAIGPCLLPLRPGILYGLDSRAGAQIGADTILDFSGMALSSQAVGPKIRWLGETEPQVRVRTHILITASSYLGHRLTGRHVMNRHEASHYMPPCNPQTQDWDARHEAQVGPVSTLPAPAGATRRPAW
jgi:xylulokinase